MGLDSPNPPVFSLANMIEYVNDREVTKVEIVIFSGRDGSCRIETEDWLGKYEVKYDQLHMREAGDNRKDSIVKRELFDTHIKGKYNVLYVVDDRNQVVDMWRNELGLTCFQVAEGDF